MRFDLKAFEPRLAAGWVVLFDDLTRVRMSTNYGVDQHYGHRARGLMERVVKRPDSRVFDASFDGCGILVRESKIAADKAACNPGEQAFWRVE